MVNNEDMNWVWVVVAIILILFLFGNVGFGMMGYGGMGGMMQWMFGQNTYGSNYGYGFMPFFGLIFMIGITILVVLAITWLIKEIKK